MGLDSVELIMEFEEAFGLVIPDDIAAGLATPRQTVDYLASRLGTAEATHCLTQQTFYRLRRGLRVALDANLLVRPGTEIELLVQKRAWPALWSKVRQSVGDTTWPENVPWKGWMSAGPKTMRDLTLRLALENPESVPQGGQPWTRELIEFTVRRTIQTQLGVTDFAFDDEYVRDMGID